MPMLERNTVISAWDALDLASAVLPADREIVAASEGVRTLIVDLILAAHSVEELYDACAVFGRIIAQRAGSPTLASATLDHLGHVLALVDPAWLRPAKAALAEGFASSLSEGVRREVMRSWEYPHCTVRIDSATLAVAAGHPSDDSEILSAWASRIGKAAALTGVRRAVISGASHPAVAAVADALVFVGIEVRFDPGQSRT